MDKAPKGSGHIVQDDKLHLCRGSSEMNTSLG